MSITDELHRLLDERGVFWVDIPLVNMKRTCWKSCDEQDGYCYFEESNFGVTNLTISNCTPEQAVAATLDSDGEYERKMDSLLCRLTGGLFSKTRAYSLDFMESCVEEAFEEEAFEAGNARPTSTTHAVTVSDESTDCATGHCECELCGEPIDPWDRFCRHCGAEVVSDG